MKSKPPVELSPWIGGGWRTVTCASRICSETPALELTRQADGPSSGAVRCCHSSRMTNAVAVLVWLIALMAL